MGGVIILIVRTNSPPPFPDYKHTIPTISVVTIHHESIHQAEYISVFLFNQSKFKVNSRWR